MSYPAISLSTATVGRHRCPQVRERLLPCPSACRPPANLPSTQIRARIIAPVTPSPPSAALTPSIPVHRWIRAKAPDLVQRQFTAEAPDRLWVADITYVPTGAGFLYLAVVVDVFSRRVVGWAMESHIRTELVLQALNMALYLRRPQGVIHHSDQGIQYTAYAFGKRCSEWSVRPSMGSVGDCYDNALCESFFASLECELLDRRSFQTHAEARMAVFHRLLCPNSL